MSQQLSEIHILLNAAWWKKPRRTRNRIMSGLSKNGRDRFSYRGLRSFLFRLKTATSLKRGWSWDDLRRREFDGWKPPTNSHDIPVADES